MKIRKATMKDASRILQLLNSDAMLTSTDELDYNSNHAREYILGKSFHTVVYVEDKKVVGVAIANIFKIGKYAEFYIIVVDPNYRKRGIAQELSNFMIDYLKKKRLDLVYLYTEEKNKPMMSLAEKLKFRKGKKIYFYFRELK
ncbi:MAG: GNAT family N-acetyltransferase [Nanoarchaeota archaeon]